MALFTLLARSTDGIPLVTTSDSANSDFLKKALYVVKSLDKNSPSKCSIKIDNNSFFHYLIEDHVCYMVETDSKYPKQLAFDYLEEVRKHFVLDQKDEVYRYGHAYAAIKFGLR
ncbi:SNAP receptor [Bonamia ostreae]|uniref:SNAP receptor n=1 Tax=Bonamia ostreae TaxID=126728 RepID=A0ABV2ASZ8_9EUKA